MEHLPMIKGTMRKTSYNSIHLKVSHVHLEEPSRQTMPYRDWNDVVCLLGTAKACFELCCM